MVLILTGLVLLAGAVGAAVFWSVVLVRLFKPLLDRPTIRKGLTLPLPEGEVPKVSVIVPAHNEQRVIETLVRSLRRQEYRNLELIFVLDRCTDATAEILARHAAEDDRIVVVENDSCPEEWSGKCYAARLGAQRATGDWLLFTDADTRFDPKLVRAAVALASTRDYSLLSLLSSLTYERAFECIAQPIATMMLMQMFPLDRMVRQERVRPFANGQFMLFQRAWYEKIGGHEAVQDELLEDLAFARLVHAAGGRGGVALADGMLVCSMYDSLEAFHVGWKRIMIEACKRRVHRLKLSARRVLGIGIGVPLLQVGALVVAWALFGAGEVLLASVLVAAITAGWIVQAIDLWIIYSLAGAPRLAMLLHPIGCWIVGKTFLEGARDLEQRRPLTWGGKQYVVEPR